MRARFERARLARGRQHDTRDTTLAQESALAADAKLLAAFYPAFSCWTADGALGLERRRPAPRR